MLFRKKIEPACAYCRKGTPLDEGRVLCLKKGTVDALSHCRGFRYDPLKRVPSAPAVPDFSKFKDEDFSL